jgi:tRNA(Ile)-lysidine synthase
VEPVWPDLFAALMAPLGPFEPAPRLAVAVSGGADSLALALLADAWAWARGGDVLALIVDHGLRPAAAAEAATTRQRLAARGMPAQMLHLTGLRHGPALAARARAARYAALIRACREAGRLHLLLGHHAADQAETVAMRMLAGSHANGLAAMPARSESAGVRLLRPLLAVPPARLRATLMAAGMAWLDDPSNADPVAQRSRLRALRRDRDGTGPATAAAIASASARGHARAWAERTQAAVLARRARIAPEGFAVLTPGAVEPGALAALIRMISGGDWLRSRAAVAMLAASPRAATLGGVRLLPAGRLLPGGWLLVREAAAMAPPVPAAAGAVWDGRFRLLSRAGLPPETELAGLGHAAARLRDRSRLPAAVLYGLPALWLRGILVAVPHLGYCHADLGGDPRIQFAPSVPAATAPFLAPTRSMSGRMPEAGGVGAHDGATRTDVRGCAAGSDALC